MTRLLTTLSRARARSLFAGRFILALPLIVAVLLYGYGVGLPFFRDDLLLIQLVNDSDGLSQWLGLGAFPFYRPAVFTLWKLLAIVVGQPDAALFHWVNVLLFGLTSVIIACLAARFLRSRPVGLGAGLGFILFPFNYEAVAWVSGAFHVLCGFGVALSLWAALHWLDHPHRRGLLILCWLSAVVGVFSQENGFLLISLSAVIVGLAARRRQRVWIIVPLLALAAVYAGLWLLVPRSAGDYVRGLDAILVNVAAMAQGMIYPLAALLGRLLGDDSQVIVPLILVSSVAIIAAALALTVRVSRPRGRVAFVAAFWYAAAVAPSVLLLATPYLLGSPRLMYMASVGAAVFWAAVLVPRRQTNRGLTLVVAFIVVLVVVSTVALDLRFILERRTDFVRLGIYSRSLIDTVANAARPGEDMLLVNAPQGLVPVHGWSPLISEGSIVMQDDFDYSTFYAIATHSAIRPFDEAISAPSIISSNGASFYAPYGEAVEGEALFALLRDADDVIVTDFEGEQFYALDAGRVEPTNLDGEALLAVFPNDGLSLVTAGATLDADRQTLDVTTAWSQAEPLPVKYYFHVFCDGIYIAQENGYPLGDLYPFSAWQPDQTVTDHRRLTLPNRLDNPACLQVYVGVYWEADAQRLPMRDPATGQDLPNQEISVPISLPTD